MGKRNGKQIFKAKNPEKNGGRKAQNPRWGVLRDSIRGPRLRENRQKIMKKPVVDQHNTSISPEDLNTKGRSKERQDLKLAGKDRGGRRKKTEKREKRRGEES